MVRVPYETDCRFYADDPRSSRIRWYAVPPDRACLPVPSFVLNSWWDVDASTGRFLALWGYVGQGEQLMSPRPSRPQPYAGTALGRAGHYCGRPEQWAGDLLLSRDGTAAVDPDGTPLCCPRGEVAGAVLLGEGFELVSVGDSPAVFTQGGQADKLAFQRPFATRLRFGLFVNATTPVYGTGLGDLTEASFAGYVRQAAKWTAPILTPFGYVELRSAALSWQKDAGPAQTVYGWFAVDNTTGVLVWAARFAIPVVVNAPGVAVRLAPLSLRLGGLFIPPPVLEYTQVALAGGGSTSHGITARSSLFLALAGGGSGTSCVQAIAFGTEALAGGGSGTTWPYSISFAAEALAGGGSGTAIGLATAFTQAENAGGGSGTADTQVRAFTQAGHAAGGSGTSCTQTGVAPSAWTLGLNFRATAGYVADGTNEVPVLGEAYPHTYAAADGTTIVGGFHGGSNVRDRDNGRSDRRFAGVNYFGDSTFYFRLDLPSTGIWEIRVAFGDAATALFQDISIQDNFVQFDRVTGTPADIAHYLDASGTDRTIATWPTSNLAFTQMMGSTTLVFVPMTTSLGIMAHIEIKKT